jgi:hypothetical protein
VVVDQEGILVRAMGGAPVLHDPQPARGDLIRDTVVEQDHAVRDVFFEPLPGEGSRPALGRDDGRHPAGLQPAEQAAQLRAQQARVRQAREQALDRVEHHALGRNGVDGVAQADEQSLQVVLPRLLDLGALDAHEVDEQLLPGAELLEVEAQGCDVLGQLLGRLLEAHEHARFAHLDAAHEELDREEGLARARVAAHERRATAGQPAARDLVQAADAASGLGQPRDDRWFLDRHAWNPRGADAARGASHRRV